jgi:hypothetical protein
MAGSGVSFETVRKIALSLEDVEEATVYGSPGFKVRGKMLACIPVNKSAEPGSLAVSIHPDRRADLLAEAPGTYYVTEHYLGHPIALVRLSRITAGELRDLLAGAWKFVGGAKPRKQKRHAPRGA